MEKLNKWLLDNKMLEVEPSIVDGSIFIELPELGKCLYLQQNEERGQYIFDEEFQFVVTDAEFAVLDAGEVENVVFSFGDKFYYSPVKKGKNKYAETAFDPKMSDLKYLGSSSQPSPVPVCHLGVHTEYEIMNGSASADLWAKKAKFLGVKSLGICDRGTLSGTLSFQTSCQKYGIKPILGMTAVVAVNYSEELENQETFDLKLFALNQRGWENLMLVNRSMSVDYDGFIPDAELFKIADGLVCVFCKESEMSYFIDDEYHVRRLASKYKRTFGKENVYFQIDSVEYASKTLYKKHLATLDKYASSYLEIVPPITINDSYYLDKEQSGLKGLLNKVSGTASAETTNQYFKNYQDILDEYEEWFEIEPLLLDLFDYGLENAEEVCNRVDFTLDSGIKKLPKFDTDDVDALFYEKIEEGWNERLSHLGKKDQKLYRERLDKECNVIVPNGLSDYFMILWDIMNYCREVGILTGPGRGSVCGSLVAYLLHITDVDPIQYGLMFERFLNETRVSGERAKSADSLPDIDCDFPTEHRDTVKEYIRQKYGTDYTCSIGTYTRMKLKTCIKDFGKVMQLSFDLTNRITKDIDDQIDYAWQDIFKYASKSKSLYDFVQKYPDIIHATKYALLQPKAESVHPSAVIIVPRHHVDGSERDMDMWSWLPVKSIDGHLVSEWEGKYIDKSGFLKEDILGLSQLDKFDSIIKMIKKNRGEDINLNDIPLDDEQTFKYFKRGWNEDVFQFGTHGLMNYCRMVKPDCLDNLIAMTSLFRPGPMELNAHQDFADIKNGKKKPNYDIGMEEITGDTFGLYVYQEQIMKAVVVGGLTEVESDVLRTTIKKKDVATLQSFGGKFKEGYAKLLEKQGVKDTKTYAESVWNKLLAFSGYGFNKSHAAAYSLMSYWSQWLKVNYPLEFWTTSFHFSKENQVPYRISEMKKTGAEVEVRPPDINISGDTFACDPEENRIFFSLSKIKGCGEVAVSAIIEERNKNGQFFSFEEFLSRVPSKVNKTVVKRLIASGAFDILEGFKNPRERKELMRAYLKTKKEDLPPEYDTKDSDTNAFWILEQKNLTGYGDIDFSAMLSDTIKSKRLLGKYVSGEEFHKVKRDEEVLIAGKLILYAERKTKRGDAYCGLNLECNDTIINVTLWPDAYERLEENIDTLKGCLIAVNGRVDFDKLRGQNQVLSTRETRLYILKVE